MSNPKINDGGPAFPMPVPHYATAEDTGGKLEHNGMSLRAYFAGLAMQGMLAGRKCDLGDVNLADMTESATKIADALIVALEVRHE